MHAAAVMSVHNGCSALCGVPLFCEATSSLSLLVFTIAQVIVIVVWSTRACVGTIGRLTLQVGWWMLWLRSRDIHGGRREACDTGCRTEMRQD